MAFPLFVMMIVIAAGALAALQAYIGSRIGTDSPAHLFLIRQVRKHGGLFSRIPALLNRPHCGANPIFLHALLARLPDRLLVVAPYFLNPIANACNTAVFAVAASILCRAVGMSEGLALAAIAVFAFCPQLFHALSARNFGFSSRGTGLLLLTVFFAADILRMSGVADSTVCLAVMIIAAYLIFGFNTFAMQALLLVGALLIPLRMDALHVLAIAGGLALFVALHRRYATSYLLYTARFIRAYGRELAAVFILERRPSLWRDLVWDIPVRIARNTAAGLHYAYENSLLVTIFLNPLSFAAIAFRFSTHYDRMPGLAAATDIALAGILAMLLTSFRATRFLGEPERYVEAVAPWIALSGAALLALSFGFGPLAWLAAAFALLSAAQVGLSWFLVSRVTTGADTTAEIAAAIRAAMPDGEVRLCANNEQLTKLLLPNDWRFSYFTAVGEPYCGMSVAETFTHFPNVNRAACERLVRTYAITVAVLQKTLYDELFDGKLPDGLMGQETIFENSVIRVVHLRWRDGVGGPAALTG